ncbi:nuclear pore complex protein Nup155 [Platysternon megacephalum]|uniref:Nuclear pore complex protein Nup155 n=1 Tax=Platysternon megacephalum TaxID=55544 RepID=A0A4D9F1W7_9SAUR|nr:nuclear pore complex protein Nup155 [Platysternon megacephalum]
MARQTDTLPPSLHCETEGQMGMPWRGQRQARCGGEIRWGNGWMDNRGVGGGHTPRINPVAWTHSMCRGRAESRCVGGEQTDLTPPPTVEGMTDRQADTGGEGATD